MFCRAMDAQKQLKKSIFGSGFIVSDRVAEMKRRKEKEIQKQRNVIHWELSSREKEIIKTLG